MRRLARPAGARGLHDAGASFPLALTFDDVLLVPQLSRLVSRKDVSLRTRLSRNIWLNNPIVASNMDTGEPSDPPITRPRNFRSLRHF